MASRADAQEPSTFSFDGRSAESVHGPSLLMDNNGVGVESGWFGASSDIARAPHHRGPLRHGRWQSTQLISPTRIARSTQPHATTPVPGLLGKYGYFW
jgi:hypothetical protein